MENSKQQAILEKIRKLLAVTKESGATEGEIENALKLAQRLMMQYDIDQDEVNLSPLDIDITEFENNYMYKESQTWLWKLLGVISECYCCSSVRVPKWDEKKRKKIYVFKLAGIDRDRRVVKQIFDTLVPFVRNMVNKRFKQYSDQCFYDMKMPSSRYNFTNSYILGFLFGLSQRLMKDREEFLKLETTEATKYEIIHVKKDALVTQFLAEKFKPKDITLSKPEEIIAEVYFMGREDGLEENGNKKLH